MKRLTYRNMTDVEARESPWRRFASGVVDHLTLLAMWAYAVWPMAVLFVVLYPVSWIVSETIGLTLMVIGSLLCLWRYATTLDRLMYKPAGDQWFAAGRRLFGLAPRYVVKRPPSCGE
jgi:hypothetical protein